MYKIELSPMAKREFKKLPNDIKDDMQKMIDDLAANRYPEGSRKVNAIPNKIKKRLGVEDVMRVKHKSFRAVYSVLDDVALVYIFKIGHRNTVYELTKMSCVAANRLVKTR